MWPVRSSSASAAAATAAAVVLYDGSPFHTDAGTPFDLAARERVSVFGTGARFLAATERADLKPVRDHDLSALRTVLSTGSPLWAGSFRYVHRGIKSDVCLFSISGEKGELVRTLANPEALAHFVGRTERCGGACGFTGFPPRPLPRYARAPEEFMKTRRLGRSGLTVSEICLGTMTFGSMADESESLAILDLAREAGIDFIDLAEVYPVPPDAKYAGRSEEICGKWLAGQRRDAYFIATKIAGPGGGWFQTPVRSGRTALDRHSIERAVEGSLRRLGTDYIDLYQVHWPDRGLPIEETLEALTRVVDAGKVRVIGCSNESAYGLMKSLWASDVAGCLRFETIQNGYSLLSRRFEDGLAEVCRREDVSLLPYSPIAGGMLSGKYQDGARPKGARFTLYADHSPRTKVMAQRFLNERTLSSTERFVAIAREAGLAPATLAVAWTLTHDFVGSTIVGATSTAQLAESLAAADVELSAEVRAACDRVSRDIPYPMG